MEIGAAQSAGAIIAAQGGELFRRDHLAKENARGRVAQNRTGPRVVEPLQT
jgi:hypothetical protein